MNSTMGRKNRYESTIFTLQATAYGGLIEFYIPVNTMKRLICLFLLCISVPVLAVDLPVVKVGVLHSGTVHWELSTMKAQGLDRANGFDLQVQPYANMSATRLALSSGGVDAIVSDWLWAGQRELQGQTLWFVPYSRAIGTVMVAANSTLQWPDQLRGKRIGVAGGPFSKGWVLIKAYAMKQGIDLNKDAEIKFAAPPLLSSELERGNLDLLVTFWHFGARLEAKGFKSLVSLDDVAGELGLSNQMPMLGYLFDRKWALGNRLLAEGFARAVTQTKQVLLNDLDSWQRLRPLMQAKDDATFETLKAGYLAGVPSTLNMRQIRSAQSFYSLIDTSRRKPTGIQLDEALFRLQP